MEILSFFPCPLPVLHSVTRANMITRQTRRALRMPNRPSLHKGHIPHRTTFLATPTSNTCIRRTEVLRRHLKTVEQRTDNPRFDERQTPLVARKHTCPLLYQSIDSLKCRDTLRQFLPFQLLAIHIKARKQYIRVGHSHRKSGMTLPPLPLQCSFQHLSGQSGIVSARADKKHILPIVPLQRDLPDKAHDNRRRCPRIYRKDKTYPFILAYTKAGHSPLQRIGDGTQFLTQPDGQLLCNPPRITCT